MPAPKNRTEIVEADFCPNSSTFSVARAVASVFRSGTTRTKNRMWRIRFIFGEQRVSTNPAGAESLPPDQAVGGHLAAVFQLEVAAGLEAEKFSHQGCRRLRDLDHPGF